MDIEQRIVSSDASFRALLDSNGVKYEEPDHCDFIILEIRESDPKWPMVKEYMTIHKILSLATPIFTKAELDNASWMTVRSKWRWEYPMRADDGSYEEVVYNTDNHCPKCGVGLVQKDLFRLRKSPNWGTKHFLMLNWIEDELFISEKAKTILSESSLKGFEFLDVLKYKKDTKLENIFQLKVTTTLAPGFVPDEEYIKEYLVCPNCSSSKWIMAGRGIAFKKSIFRDDIDIAKSYEGFGFGCAAPNEIFISQRFYRLIMDNKLNRNLEFVPVDLKD